MLGGFISLSYEIFLFRTISFATGSSSLAFALTLAAFLIGIAVGARNAAQACDRTRAGRGDAKGGRRADLGQCIRRGVPAADGAIRVDRPRRGRHRHRRHLSDCAAMGRIAALSVAVRHCRRQPGRHANRHSVFREHRRLRERRRPHRLRARQLAWPEVDGGLPAGRRHPVCPDARRGAPRARCGNACAVAPLPSAS